MHKTKKGHYVIKIFIGSTRVPTIEHCMHGKGCYKCFSVGTCDLMCCQVINLISYNLVRCNNTFYILRSHKMKDFRRVIYLTTGKYIYISLTNNINKKKIIICKNGQSNWGERLLISLSKRDTRIDINSHLTLVRSPNIRAISLGLPFFFSTFGSTPAFS